MLVLSAWLVSPHIALARGMGAFCLCDLLSTTVRVCPFVGRSGGERNATLAELGGVADGLQEFIEEIKG